MQRMIKLTIKMMGRNAFILSAILVGYIVGMTHGFDKGYAFYSTQVTSDIREFIADPHGTVWIGQIRIETVNKAKSYFKVAAR
jgi:hypothetical protein